MEVSPSFYLSLWIKCVMANWGQHISSFVFMFGSVRFSSIQFVVLNHFVFFFILKLFHCLRDFLFFFLSLSLSLARLLSMSLCLLISMQSFKLYYFCFIIYGKINFGSVGKSQFCYFVVCFYFFILVFFLLLDNNTDWWVRMETHSFRVWKSERKENERKENRDEVRMLRNDWQTYTTLVEEK